MVKSNTRTLKLVLFSEYYWPFRCPQKPSKNTIKRQNLQPSNRSYVTLGGKTLISVLPTLSGMTHRDRKQFDYIRLGGALWGRCQPTNGCRGTFFQSLHLWVFLTTWISTTEGRVLGHRQGWEMVGNQRELWGAAGYSWASFSQGREDHAPLALLYGDGNGFGALSRAG